MLPETSTYRSTRSTITRPSSPLSEPQDLAHSVSSVTINNQFLTRHCIAIPFIWLSVFKLIKNRLFHTLTVTVLAHLSLIAILHLSQSTPQENKKFLYTNTWAHRLPCGKIIFMVLLHVSEDIIRYSSSTYAAVTLHIGVGGGHTSANLYNSSYDSWHRTHCNSLSSFSFLFWLHISRIYWRQVMRAEDILPKGAVNGLYCVQL